MAADRLGVEPANCVVFEDSAVGVAAGKAAGMIKRKGLSVGTKCRFARSTPLVPTLRLIRLV